MAERITFAVSLYAPEAVEEAASAYAELAKIEVEKSDDEIVVLIDDVTDHDPQLIAHAFSNHALHETISRRRQAALDEV